MKIIEKEFVREIDAAKAVVLWNYWDHEHLFVVHKNYTDARIIYEDQKMAVYLLTFKLPVFSFMKSKSLNVMIQKTPEIIKVYNVGLFNLLSATTITVKELEKDKTRITMNYKFVLTGWRTLLAPFLNFMIAKWNQQVWDEDLPIKLRRQKALRMGFKDFIGLPKNIQERIFDDDLELILPIARHVDSPVNFPL
jgi:hypothetical protein